MPAVKDGCTCFMKSKICIVKFGSTTPFPLEDYRENVMTIEIRILNQDDVELLKNVDPDVFDDPIDIPRAIEFLGDPRHHLGVAIDGDLVVGFVSAVHYNSPCTLRFSH
jgi:hypothetical protein